MEGTNLWHRKLILNTCNQHLIGDTTSGYSLIFMGIYWFLRGLGTFSSFSGRCIGVCNLGCCCQVGCRTLLGGCTILGGKLALFGCSGRLRLVGGLSGGRFCFLRILRNWWFLQVDRVTMLIGYGGGLVWQRGRGIAFIARMLSVDSVVISNVGCLECFGVRLRVFWH